MLICTIEERYGKFTGFYKVLVISYAGQTLYEIPDWEGPDLDVLKEWIEWAYQKGLSDAQ